MPARLEDLTPGAVVGGVVAGQAVTRVAAEWHSSDVCADYLGGALVRLDPQVLEEPPW